MQLRIQKCLTNIFFTQILFNISMSNNRNNMFVLTTQYYKQHFNYYFSYFQSLL